MSLQKTFDGLDPLEEIPKEIKIIDVAEKCANDVYGDERTVISMMSKVKPGLLVKTQLTKAQSKKVRLDVLERKLIDEIYDSNTSLRLSHRATINNLFGQEFNITLMNSGYGLGGQTSHKEKMEIHKKKSKTKNDDFTDDAAVENIPVLKEKIILDALDSLDATIKTDGPTKKIIKERWLPTLKQIEIYRLKYAVCPIFFALETSNCDSYSVKLKKVRKKTAASSKNTNVGIADDGYANAENTNGIWSLDKNNVPAYGDFFGDDAIKDPKFLENVADEIVKNKRPKAGKKSATDVIESEGIVQTNYLQTMFPENADWSKKNNYKKRNYNYNVKTGAEAIYDARDDHLSMTTPDGAKTTGNMSDFSLPYPHYENSFSSKEIEKFRNVEFSLMHGENKNEKTKTKLRNKLKQGVQPIGNYVPENTNDKKIFYVEEDLDSNLDRDKASGKKRKFSNISENVDDISRSTPKLTSSGETPPPNKLEKRKYAKNENDIKLLAIEREIKHYVPVVPPMDEGFIETYWDDAKNQRRFFWSWNSTHKNSFGIEPYMLWLVFEEPTHDKFQSDVATLIPIYQEVQLAKKTSIDRAKRESEQTFIVEKIESKLRPKEDDALSGANYVPMMTGQTTNERSAYSSLNLNEAEIMAREREMLYAPHLRNTRPRGYLPEYGFNSKPHWDQGRLLDKTSEQYRNSCWQPQQFNPLRTNGGFRNGQQHNQSMYYKNAVQNNLMRFDQIANQHQSEMDSAKTNMLLERRTIKTPNGTFIFLDYNEKITSLDKMSHTASLESSISQMQSLKNEFEHMGSVMGGSPNTIISRNERKSGAGKDGIFTSKHAQTTSNYGLNISEPMFSPSEQYRNNTLHGLRNIYTSVVSEMFQIAYGNIFQEHENWYKRSIQSYLHSVLTSEQKFDGDFLSNLEFPTFMDNFKVVVTFYSKKTTVDAGTLLDFYKLKFYTAEEVFLELSNNQSNNSNSAVNTNLQRMVDKNKEDGYSYENKLKRFTKGLEEALEHDKKIGMKELQSPIAAKKKTAGKQKKPDTASKKQPKEKPAQPAAPKTEKPQKK